MAKVKSSYKESWEPPKANRGEELNEPKANYNYDYRYENQYTDRSQERAIRRYEARDVYQDMFELNQRRDQRAFERVKDMENEFYAGVDPRRKIELAEGGMIKEDRSAMANLPVNPIHAEYPQAPFYQSQYIDDTVRGDFDELDDNRRSNSRYQNPYNLTLFK